MKKIAFYPYQGTSNEYIVSMRNLLREKAELVDYTLARIGLYSLSQLHCIYLNWIEGSWTLEDEIFLEKARKHNVKIIWVFHNRIPHDTKKECVDEKKRIMSFLVDVATHIVIHSESSIKYLLEFNRHVSLKCVVIPHVNYEDVYCDFGGNIRRRLHIADDKMVIGFFGLIKPYKNIELLIDVFKDLKMENTSLMIVGKALDVQYYRALKERVGDVDNIVVRNQYINNVEMKSYLDAVDVVALPYNMESSMNSGTMIMAFSYGKTVIVPRIAMSDAYPEDLIYKYDYADETSHYKALKEQIETAYRVGREQNLVKGELLQRIVTLDNSPEMVKKELFKII